jgi:hyperosmotically inducible periplasmic protein
MNSRFQTIVLSYLFVAAVASVISIGSTGCTATRTKESTGQYVDDSAITTKVKAKLLDDPVVSGLRISVETYKGVVQLSGFANSTAEIKEAESLATNTDGVVSVRNDIQLKR